MTSLPKPIGYARAIDVDAAHRPFIGRTSFWCSESSNAYYDTPLYLAAAPAAPQASTIDAEPAADQQYYCPDCDEYVPSPDYSCDSAGPCAITASPQASTTDAEPVAYRITPPMDEIYGQSGDFLQFHPLTEHDIAAGYSQTPLAPQNGTEELVKALEMAIEVLDCYADPTGYFDNNGEELHPGTHSPHPGILAGQIRDKLTALIAKHGGRS